MITLTDTFDVLVDGVHAGALCDTINNRPELASDIQRAIPGKLSELAKPGLDAQAELAALQAELAALKARQKTLVEQAADAHARGDLDGIGAVIAEAGKDEVQRKKDALSATIAAAQADLAKLE